MTDMPARNAGLLPRLGGAKSSAEDEEVNFVYRVSNHDGVFSDRINSLAVRVDECDVGEVKAWEIFVVKTRPLAPARVPWFQFLGSGLVLHNIFDATTDFLLSWEIKGMHGCNVSGYRIHCDFGRPSNEGAKGWHLCQLIGHHVDWWPGRGIADEGVKVFVSFL